MVGRSTVVVTAESQAQLQELAGSHERGEADRARAILLTLAGWSSGRIGEAFGVREDTVRLWRMTFMQGGVAWLRRSSSVRVSGSPARGSQWCCVKRGFPLAPPPAHAEGPTGRRGGGPCRVAPQALQGTGGSRRHRTAVRR